MEIELRVRNDSGIEEALAIGRGLVNTVAVGDDGCIHKVPKSADAVRAREQIERAGYKFRIVTPKLPELHIDDMVATMKNLHSIGDNFSLTVNDFGLLYACVKHSILPKTITMGRTIARSQQDCPWLEHLHKDSREFVEQMRSQNNMYDEQKIDFFRNHNAASIETNWHPQDSSSLMKSRERGLRVGIHLGYPSVAFARACPIAKYFHKSVPECRDLCVRPMAMNFSQIYSGVDYQRVPLANAGIYPFLLLGNVLYSEIFHEPSVNSVRENADYIIVNSWQFKNTAELKNFLEKQKMLFESKEGAHGKTEN